MFSLLLDGFMIWYYLVKQEAESMTQSWATFQHTNPMTGEPMPELIDWSGAPQVNNRESQVKVNF